MTEKELRKAVKEKYPHIKISIKKVSFQDLARGSKKVITITGDRNKDELKEINDWAFDAGILRDTNIRFR